MPYTVRSHPRDFAVFPKVAYRARINVAAGAGTHLQQHEVGFLRDLAGIVLAAPLGYDDVGFRRLDE